MCTLDSDCPIGYECLNSYCVEKTAGTPDNVTKQDENPLPQNDNNTVVQDEDTAQKVDNEPDTVSQKDEEQIPDETVDIPTAIDEDNFVASDEDNTIVTPDETQDEDTVVVTPGCGNSVVDNGEACEIDDTRNCTAFPTNGFASGTATCKPDCSDWDISACVCPLGTEQNNDGKCEVLCGNGAVDGDEACEPSDTKECTTFVDAGFLSGSATCETDCTAWIKALANVQKT